ncbi:DUF4445 domain-containing protein [SAR202 cluster bacterium AD-804-J14_MRT_500m]|nr:DUF4445 domain-containing protein [SAR202 cluster bacterium AD-804-J14_MRT_500m]
MSPLFCDGRQMDLKVGKSLFDYADQVHVRVPTSCGRNGECHECIVEVRRGEDALTRPTTSETFLKDGFRLACQAKIRNLDGYIELAVSRRQPQILTHSIKRAIDLDPLTIRHGEQVRFQGRRIDEYRRNIFGLAIDMGTTTVAMNLVDLETGNVVYTTSFENPQRFGGSDVMNRISYDGGPYRGELRQSILSAINFEIGDIVRRLKIHRRLIYEAVVVANTTIRDLFFGLDVQPIGERPYKSTTELDQEQGLIESTSLSVRASEIGLRINSQANVYGGPLIGCHVGADVAADMLALSMDEEDRIVMLVDIGTNTEVVIGNRHKFITASCPAGPAFEGGNILYGMPGYEGAVESVKIIGNEVQLKTIGDQVPHGICGSGLVDLLAELRLTGKMDPLGVFVDGSQEFSFAPEQGMTLSRSDISILAQAKAANFCGQFILLREYDIHPDQVDNLYLAGAFANYVDTNNAIDIGFVANIPHERIIKAGNASLEGATIMLLSSNLRNRIETMARQIRHVELETTTDFFDIFVEGCMFKPMQAEAL